MAKEVVLPRVDMDMATGKMGRWFVAEGERVREGQLLFEIATDKAAMEVEAPIPYSPVLEMAAVPQVEDIVAAARFLAQGRA